METKGLLNLNEAKENFTKNELVEMLNSTDKNMQFLFNVASIVKKKHVDDKVYLRGLIELSNYCAKDCLYCGIRKSNKAVQRYSVSDDEVIEAAKFALKNNFGSIVIQSGEIASNDFISRIEMLIMKIKSLSPNYKLGITLSLGEQSYSTYKRWFDAGAHRYLLRIESSSEDIYSKIHPKAKKYDFKKRLEALENIKKSGFQLGTGVMIGLPFQNNVDLANDLLFMKNLDIDMCGMGPYIEHEQTPLFKCSDNLLLLNDRYILSLKMIAILRLLMKDINIAASTAMQALKVNGREEALKVGANVVMPNITPSKYRDNYKLYKNKPCANEEPEDSINNLKIIVKNSGNKIAFGEWGDSKHFLRNKL